MTFADALYERLLIDAEWSVRRPDGFTWWPHRLAQVVRLEPASGGAARIHVETDVLLAGAVTERLAATLVELMRHPAMSAFVHVAADGAVRLWSAARVSRENSPVVLPRLATAAALQATYAEMGLESLTGRTGLSPATSAHPDSGARPHADGLLDLVAARIAPEGEGASLYAGSDEWPAAADALEANGWSVSVDARGLTARCPPGLLLEARHAETHPELGSGLFVRLFLPSARVAPSARAALQLNELERHEAGPAAVSTGAWCLEQSEPAIAYDVRPAPPRLAFVEFLPNALFLPGLVAESVRDVASRASRASWASRADYFGTNFMAVPFMQ